jgi:hypothetical protein
MGIIYSNGHLAASITASLQQSPAVIASVKPSKRFAVQAAAVYLAM